MSTDATTRPDVAPVMTMSNIEAGLAVLLLAVEELLDGAGTDPDRLDTLRVSFEAYRGIRRAYEAQPNAETDRLIDRFATAIKAKLTRAEAKHGWQNAWAKADWEIDCRADLGRHVLKGDPLDVAAYSAFCWHHHWQTRPPIPDLDTPGSWTLARAFELGFVWRGMVDHHLREDRGTSRDVGRTLTSPIFDGLPLDRDAVPNHRSAVDGVVIAKHEIVRALATVPPDTGAAP